MKDKRDETFEEKEERLSIELDKEVSGMSLLLNCHYEETS